MGLQDSEEFCAGFRKQVLFGIKGGFFLSLFFPLGFWPTLIGPRH